MTHTQFYIGSKRPFSLVWGRRKVRAALFVTGIVGLGPVAPMAHANLVINAIYSSDISPEARAVIANANKFYTDNFKGNVSITIGYGMQPGGGASATYSVDSVSYDQYVRQLRGNTAESAVDVSALSSLPATAPIGNGTVVFSEALGANLGLLTINQPKLVEAGKNCAGLSVQACVAFGSGYLSGAGISGGLYGVTQHEINEVLGTASNLAGSTTPTSPSAADLFRNGAPRVRSWSANSSTGQPCDAGTPGAYVSVNSGQTNLASYNNCNNGGDYGDFASPVMLKQVQDAFGDTTSPSSITLSSPEASLLDAVGWNYVGSTVVASGTPTPVTERAVLVGQRVDGIPTSTPEPATLALAGGALALLLIRKRRVARG